MKYIITAKNIQDNLSVTDPCKRTEIATELISTRIKALIMLDRGVISKSDTIVTRIDRKCLYDQLFDNVMDWEEFDKSRLHYNHRDVVDLVNVICDGSIDSKENFDKAFPIIPDSIFNISFCELKDNKKPFICILARSMKNDIQKNLGNKYWIELIEKFLELTKNKIDVFIFGANINLEKEIEINEACRDVEIVKTFKGWCSLLSNKKCRAVISTCSGGVYPLFFVGNKDTELIIIDNNKLTIKHENSPSFYNWCINFKSIGIVTYFEVPPIKDWTHIGKFNIHS